MSVRLSKQAIDLGIVTSNGEAMLAFYRDVLGLPYLREMAMPGGGLMHQLACGDSVIKLVVSDKVKDKPGAPGGIQGASGYRYWTMTVSNLSEVLESCSRHGHKLVVPERELRPGVRLGIVEDPDRNWVELLSVG